MKESGKSVGKITVIKYNNDEDYRVGKVAEKIVCNNLFLTAGMNELWELVTGESANHFDNTNARIGIGDDKTTAPAYGQTDLQAATNKTYKAMDATYPTTPANRTQVFKSTFGSSDANYEWGEFVIKNNVSGICLNRSTNSGAGWGTKTAGTTWEIYADLTIN